MRAEEFVQTDEGIKSALAGAALAGTMVAGSPAAKADDPPNFRQQIVAAIKANQIPMPKDYVTVIKDRAGVALQVEIDGHKHDMPVSSEQRSHLAQIAKVRDQMGR